MTEHLNPVIAVNNAAFQSMRRQGIERIHFDHDQFSQLAELSDRDLSQAGKLNLAYGGVRKGLGAIRYNPDEEYHEVLHANGRGSDLRYGNLPAHDPTQSQEAGLLMAWPIPKEWTDEALSWNAFHALRLSPPYLKNSLMVVGSSTAVGAAGGAYYAHETGGPVGEYAAWFATGALGMAGLVMSLGVNVASNRNTAALRKKAESLKPFRIIHERQPRK